MGKRRGAADWEVQRRIWRDSGRIWRGSSRIDELGREPQGKKNGERRPTKILREGMLRLFPCLAVGPLIEPHPFLYTVRSVLRPVISSVDPIIEPYSVRRTAGALTTFTTAGFYQMDGSYFFSIIVKFLI